MVGGCVLFEVVPEEVQSAGPCCVMPGLLGVVLVTLLARKRGWCWRLAQDRPDMPYLMAATPPGALCHCCRPLPAAVSSRHQTCLALHSSQSNTHSKQQRLNPPPPCPPPLQPSDNELMDVMHSLTTVRALLANGLSSGLRNDAPDSSMIMRQRWRLAEVRAEEFFFVLLSRFINLQESRGGYGSLAK